MGFVVNTTDDGSYQLATPYTPDEVGEWQIKAEFDGSTTLKATQRSNTFKVVKGTAVIAFENADSASLGTELELVASLEPKLIEEAITLKILQPDGSASTITDIRTVDLGIFKQKVNLNLAGNWTLTATWSGNEEYESVTKTLTIKRTNQKGNT